MSRGMRERSGIEEYLSVLKYDYFNNSHTCCRSPVPLFILQVDCSADSHPKNESWVDHPNNSHLLRLIKVDYFDNSQWNLHPKNDYYINSQAYFSFKKRKSGYQALESPFGVLFRIS